MSFIIDYEDIPVIIDALGTAEYEDRPHPAHDYRELRLRLEHLAAQSPVVGLRNAHWAAQAMAEDPATFAPLDQWMAVHAEQGRVIIKSTDGTQLMLERRVDHIHVDEVTMTAVPASNKQNVWVVHKNRTGTTDTEAWQLATALVSHVDG